MKRHYCPNLTKEELLLREAALKAEFGYIFTNDTLVGRKWLLAHCNDIDWAEIQSQTLTVTIGSRVTTIKQAIKLKDLRMFLKDRIKAGSHASGCNPLKGGE